MSDEHIIKQPLPFAECRYSKNSVRHYKSHMHKDFGIGGIDQGKVEYQVEGKSVRLQPGSLTLINPETLHSCNPAESGTRSYYMLFLDVGWCLQVQQSLWQVETFIPVNTLLLNDISIYRKYIDAMESLMGDGDLLEKEQILFGVVELIFLHACETACVNSELPSKIEQLKHYLSLDLDADTTMRELSVKLHTNPYTLLRQFKSATGITPHAYRLNCRIELAKKLLQKGDDLSHVALECGFYDQSHFHRHFKAITTVTPREYQVNFVQ